MVFIAESCVCAYLMVKGVAAVAGRCGWWWTDRTSALYVCVCVDIIATLRAYLHTLTPGLRLYIIF